MKTSCLIFLFICLGTNLGCGPKKIPEEASHPVPPQTTAPLLRPKSESPVKEPSEAKACYYGDKAQTPKTQSHPYGLDRRQVKAHVWTMPIGQNFKTFVFESAPARQMSQDARNLAAGVLSEEPLTLPRIEALRLLTEDLYDCDLVTPDRLARIQLLNLEIDRARELLDKEHGPPSLVHMLPYFAGASLFAGSPLLRLQSKTAARQLLARFKSWVLHSPSPESTLAARLASKNALRFYPAVYLRDYELGHAYMMFIQTSMAYMILNEALETIPHPKSKTLDFGAESLLSLLEFSTL